MIDQKEYKKLADIFIPQYLLRVDQLKNSHKKLVHYTSATTALSILKNQEIWMRNTKCMNDFLEVRYGCRLFENLKDNGESKKFEQLKEAFGKQGDAFEQGFFHAINEFDAWTNTTYIACLSEHEPDEDKYGRLSMWRGYGRDSGVALVSGPAVKPTAF